MTWRIETAWQHGDEMVRKGQQLRQLVKYVKCKSDVVLVVKQGAFPPGITKTVMGPDWDVIWLHSSTRTFPVTLRYLWANTTTQWKRRPVLLEFLNTLLSLSLCPLLQKKTWRFFYARLNCGLYHCDCRTSREPVLWRGSGVYPLVIEQSCSD